MTQAATWDAALSEYRRLRMDSAFMPLGAEGEDEAIDAYCEALDELMQTPAPSFDALATKFELGTSRSGQDALFDAYASAILADIRRLGGIAERPAFDAADWIERAAIAGLAFFARGDELWIGAIHGASPAPIASFRQELDGTRTAAIVDVLTARGLTCAEAEA